jgi:hypothetical protein
MLSLLLIYPITDINWRFEMSKKRQRISYLVGIRNAINNTSTQPDVKGFIYSEGKIKAIIETLDHLLKEDGIVGINANDKVNG